MLQEFDKALASSGNLFFLPVRDIILILFSFMRVLHPQEEDIIIIQVSRGQLISSY